MRSFDLGRRFALVTIPFRAFSHCLTAQEQLACLAAVRRHLEPGGAVALDVFDPLLEVLAVGAVPERLGASIVAARQRDRVGQQVRLLIDGPAADHDLVLRGRLEGQAPDIDPCVYLTECDPSELSAGQFVTAEIVGSREYDLIARPVDVLATV